MCYACVKFIRVCCYSQNPANSYLHETEELDVTINSNDIRGNSIVVENKSDDKKSDDKKSDDKN